MSPARLAEPALRWPPGEPVYLLDVNVLLALLDPLHSHHPRAHAWFAAHGARAWASCAVTQNGALRIMAHRSYPNRVASVAEAAEVLAEFCAQPAHRYWPGELSLLDSPLVERGRLLSPAQVTDTWLLALAVRHGGRLATFDRRLVTDAVAGGREALQQID
ncbi:TA system VapC family ribonuclease toxin [Stenotrophomonas sp. MMGLT7]|uniref:TA system VapC family ribonuclease toxin n=1 Tax=Stenotrophomonas sp. MMGLT7 TaxID=2901227 RepID=UPI001E37716E|nr:PIN domain-containing protein [Stenotrophomonas sp. MMGLT7]